MVVIEPMLKEHWNAVSKIYEERIATGVATFETSAPSYTTWDTAHLKTCRIVALQHNQVVGWAALSPVSNRCVYGGIAEVSVYISTKSRNLGIGKLLLGSLILESEVEGFWTLQSGIFPENKASIHLHEVMGFRRIGKREKIGKTSAGVWKDNVLFERRSANVGVG